MNKKVPLVHKNSYWERIQFIRHKLIVVVWAPLIISLWQSKLRVQTRLLTCHSIGQITVPNWTTILEWRKVVLTLDKISLKLLMSQYRWRNRSSQVRVEVAFHPNQWYRHLTAQIIFSRELQIQLEATLGVRVNKLWEKMEHFHLRGQIINRLCPQDTGVTLRFTVCHKREKILIMRAVVLKSTRIDLLAAINSQDIKTLAHLTC